MLYYVPGFYPFLRLDNISLYVYAILCLFIHLSMKLGLPPSFGDCE